MSDSTSREAVRAEQLTKLLADAPKPDDHEGVRDYLHDLAAQGCAVLLVMPNSKKPFDGRTVRVRNSADRAAQKIAREAGQRDWRRVKSASGVHLASDDPVVLDGYLAQYVAVFGEAVPINVAVAVGRSRLVVVDCDTASQRAAFLADAQVPGDIAPTVRSPGAVDPVTGNWVHKDGGHYYFTVPEGLELPTGIESVSIGDEEAYSAFWGPGKYVLVPPSVRAEGPYERAGSVYGELPDWLRDHIVDFGRLRAERAERSRGRLPSIDDPVAQWGAVTPWATILDAAGWVCTGVADNCGCDTWTAPGDHASEKSATAHEPGCTRWTDSPDPPLHLWTDHDVDPLGAFLPSAEGTGTVSRLQAYAAVHHDNNIGAAMEALGLHREPVTLDAGRLNEGRDNMETDSDQNAASSGRRVQVTWASDIQPEPVPWLWVDVTRQNTWSADKPAGTTPDAFFIEDIACVADGHPWFPPEVEDDGRIACGMLSIAAGREGTGKSSFAIWLTSKITRGTLPGAYYGTPRKVFYLATEDSWKHTLVPRLIAAGADLSMVGRIDVVVRAGSTVTLSLPDDTALLTQEIIDHGVALVVVDPLMSTLGKGLDANGSRDVRTALEPLAAMADQTGAAVVGIAHFNKASGLDALSRITGSGAFKDVARAVLVFADDGEQRVFTQPKNSVGRYDLPSLNYEIRGAVVDTPTGKTSTGVFRFTRVADRSVDDMLADERGRRKRRNGVTAFVIDYLTLHGDEKTGEVDAAEVIAAGEERGYKRKQIIDARSRCTDPEICTRKDGFGENAGNIWWIRRIE
ncbi:MAG: AAA family ATPase [Mycobacterium sp.]|nr:AAA family ATPase [Mycobacterium sp.]